jgi:hypothetical protein
MRFQDALIIMKTYANCTLHAFDVLVMSGV